MLYDGRYCLTLHAVLIRHAACARRSCCLMDADEGVIALLRYVDIFRRRAAAAPCDGRYADAAMMPPRHVTLLSPHAAIFCRHAASRRAVIAIARLLLSD